MIRVRDALATNCDVVWAIPTERREHEEDRRMDAGWLLGISRSGLWSSCKRRAIDGDRPRAHQDDGGHLEGGRWTGDFDLLRDAATGRARRTTSERRRPT